MKSFFHLFLCCHSSNSGIFTTTNDISGRKDRIFPVNMYSKTRRLFETEKQNNILIKYILHIIAIVCLKMPTSKWYAA